VGLDVLNLAGKQGEMLTAISGLWLNPLSGHEGRAAPNRPNRAHVGVQHASWGALAAMSRRPLR